MGRVILVAGTDLNQVSHLGIEQINVWVGSREKSLEGEPPKVTSKQILKEAGGEFLKIF